MNSVLDIVVAHLEDHGCTGLHNPSEECACILPDIAPCGEMKDECVPGVAYYCPENEGGEECPCGGEYDFHVEPPPLDVSLEPYRITFVSKGKQGGDGLRCALGQPGVRDPCAPCSEFDPGEVRLGTDKCCETDGHYLCSECNKRR